MKKLIPFLFFLTTSSWAWAQDPGTNAADILTVPVGVRPAALGGTYSAFGDDVHVLGFNPAGLARITKYSLGLDHVEGFAGVETESLSLAIPTKDAGNWGGQVVFRHMPDIQNELATDPPVSAFDFVLMVANAHQFGKLSVGAALKAVVINLGDKQAITQAVDFGVKVQFLEMDIAAVVQNLGPPLQFPGSPDKDPLPLTFRLGLSRPILVSPASTLLASVEGINVRAEGFQASIGVEYWHRSLLALRVGYRVAEGGNLNTGFSAGAALRHNLGRLEYEIGYAWHPSQVSSSFMAPSNTFGLLFWY